MNVPLSRSGGTRATVGLPGSGLSWTEEVNGNSRRPRSVRERQQAQRPIVEMIQKLVISADFTG